MADNTDEEHLDNPTINQSEKSFRAYIKATGEEHAQIMQQFWDDNDKKKSKNNQKVEVDED